LPRALGAARAAPVAHLLALRGPERARAPAAELRVVGVGGHDQHRGGPLDLARLGAGLALLALLLGIGDARSLIAHELRSFAGSTRPSRRRQLLLGSVPQVGRVAGGLEVRHRQAAGRAALDAEATADAGLLVDDHRRPE